MYKFETVRSGKHCTRVMQLSISYLTVGDVRNPSLTSKDAQRAPKELQFKFKKKVYKST